MWFTFANAARSTAVAARVEGEHVAAGVPLVSSRAVR
jgi:hypothetical protein